MPPVLTVTSPGRYSLSTIETCCCDCGTGEKLDADGLAVVTVTVGAGLDGAAAGPLPPPHAASMSAPAARIAMRPARVLTTRSVRAIRRPMKPRP